MKTMRNKEKENTLAKLSVFDCILLIFSFAAPIIAFFAFKGTDYLNLVSSLVGVAMLFLVAKANVFGSVVSIAFSILYSIVSFRFRYYGEMILYLGLYIPIEVVTLVVWFKNRYNKTSQVKVETEKPIDFLWSLVLGSAVTFGAYFLLRHLGTENLMWSTVSVFTSMVACYFILRRTSFYAIFYAINDVILVILWTYAAVKDSSYICMAICFLCFLINDVYGFFSWTSIRRRQEIR